MAIVITQAEMIQYLGKSKAVFPAGVIVTPLAKDFAAENSISIVIGESGDGKENGSEAGANDIVKKKFLNNVIESIMENAAKSNIFLSEDDFVKTVIVCLQKAGCSIEM